MDAKCSTCAHSILAIGWCEYKCKKKQRACTESEVLMGCSDYVRKGTKPGAPKPEIIVRSGATFIPSISKDGVLSWTNNKDLPNPKPIKVVGKDGVDGKDGYTPRKGIDYFDGADGKDGYTPRKGKDYFDGKNGKDGYTPVRGKDYFTEADKTELVNDVIAALPSAEGVGF